MECLSHTRKHKFNSWTAECLTITQLFSSFFFSFFFLSHARRMNDIQDKYGEKPRKEKGFVETIKLVFFI